MINEFFLRFLGVIAGALPFVVLGVCVATLIQIYSKPSWYNWIFKTNFLLSHITIALIGLLIPICECGNIPVIKKLLDKNFSFSHAVTFLLAAPIVNPVTIFTTYQAFKDYPALVGFRIVGGFLIALVIGLIFSLNKNNEVFLKRVDLHEHKHNHDHNHEHSHSHAHSATDECLIPANSPLSEHIRSFASHYCIEFIGTLKYLILGSFLSASFQLLVPLQWIEYISQNPIASLFALMLFAFVISVCSNVDAFIGLSFINNFSVNSILGFLVFGPMIDIKTVTMLKNIFTTQFIVVLTLLTFSSTTLLVSAYYVVNIFHIL